MLFTRSFTKREKELITKEAEVWRDKEIARVSREVVEAQVKGSEQEREYECTWHDKREGLRVELAKLEAEKSMLEREKGVHAIEIKAWEDKYSSLNNECVRLYKVIDSLIAKQPVPSDVKIIK